MTKKQKQSLEKGRRSALERGEEIGHLKLVNSNGESLVEGGDHFSLSALHLRCGLREDD